MSAGESGRAQGKLTSEHTVTTEQGGESVRAVKVRVAATTEFDATEK
jgi:hypothetical protein